MRGIGKGQTLLVLVSPEVLKLVVDAMAPLSVSESTHLERLKAELHRSSRSEGERKCLLCNEHRRGSAAEAGVLIATPSTRAQRLMQRTTTPDLQSLMASTQDKAAREPVMRHSSSHLRLL